MIYFKNVDFKTQDSCSLIKYRDVSTGATGTTAVAPKFSNTPILSQPRGGGQILPTIAEVTTKLSQNRISFNTNSNVTNFLLDLNNPPTFSKFLGL